jgi:hypothetical protein
MESIQHIKTYRYFDVPDEDFDKFQNIFSQYDTMSEEESLSDVECSEETFSRKYTDDEIKSIFWEDAKLSGRDKEIRKNKVSNFSDRRGAIDELKKFIKKGDAISLESAKTLLKVAEAFERYECDIED